MKQLIFRHLIALILIMCCTLGYAQKFEYEGLTYKVINTSKRCVEVVGVADKANTKTVKIPTIFTRGGVTYTVTSIGYMAFSDCYKLTSITIPNSVTSIDKEAFEDCSSLTSITIPSSVTRMGHEVFEGCKNLKTVILPEHINNVYMFIPEGVSIIRR